MCMAQGLGLRASVEKVVRGLGKEKVVRGLEDRGTEMSTKTRSFDYRFNQAGGGEW